MAPRNDNSHGFLLPNEPTYIVACSGSEAKIFSSQRRFGKWNEVKYLENPGATLREKERSTDRPGRTFDRFGNGRHAMTQEETGREHELQQFASSLADYLGKAQSSGAFRQLILVAEPTFLGYVRRKLSAPLKRTLCFEVPKNPAGFDTERLRAMFS